VRPKSKVVMSLPEVAAAIPTHQRYLRLILSDPDRALMAPQPLPREGHLYRFERRTVEAWLKRRQMLREQLKKPHLRWCDPAAGEVSVAAPEATEHRLVERTEATIALQLRAHLAETLGDRLSPQDIDKQVLAVLHGTREAHQLGLA